MQQFKISLNLREKYVIIIHILLGVTLFYFVLHPLTMIIYWFEFNHVEFSFPRVITIVGSRIQHSFSFHMMPMSGIFMFFGALTGLGSGLYYKTILRKNEILRKQEQQLERNIISIINEGESAKVEFKSSCRYDYKTNVINKKLEEVIIKTIAGFLNTTGGTLLIGVDDSGKVLGLENDYATLKQKNRDGFEQKIFQLVSTCISTEFCSLIQISFHKLKKKDISRIDIESSKIPAYVKTNERTIFYLRTGNSTKPLTTQEAVNYINLRKEKQHI